MMKKSISLILVFAFLLTSVSVMAAGEIPSADSLIYYNDGTSTATISGASNSFGMTTAEDGALKMQSKADTTYQIQIEGFRGSTGEVSGILNFKMKPMQTDKNFFLEIRDDGAGGKGITTLLLTKSGKVVFTADSSWTSNADSLSGSTNARDVAADNWYDIALVFNADYTLDYYIDGECFGSAMVPTEFNLTSQNIAIKPTINFNDKQSEPGIGTIYFDDISWIAPNEDSFYAYMNEAEISADSKALKIKFTEPVINTLLADDVKIYNTKTGTEVSAAVEFTDVRTMAITINSSLVGGDEYRVELPAFIGILGSKIYNDNVYFVTGATGEVIESLNQSFDDYTVANITDYYKNKLSYYYPTEAFLGGVWDSQAQAVAEPVQDAEKGTVMRFGKKAEGNYTSGSYAEPSVYFPMSDKIDKGITTISFSIKPENYQIPNKDNKANIGFLLNLYPEEISDAECKTPTKAEEVNLNKISATDKSIGVFGVIASNIAFTHTGNIRTASDRWGVLSTWAPADIGYPQAGYKIENPDKSKWYDIDIVIDYTNKTMSYYIDDTILYKSTKAIDAFGLENGFSGIGFYSEYGALNASTLIDDLRVVTKIPVGSDVKNIRFTGVDDSSYGLATEVTTLAKELKIEFWDEVDDSSLTLDSVKLTSDIGQVNTRPGSYIDKVYTIPLDNLLKKNTNYTLIVSGVTSDGVKIKDYSVSFKTTENGEFVINPVYITKNGSNATDTSMTRGDIFKIGAVVANTTGEEKKITLSYGAYNGKVMKTAEADEETLNTDKQYYNNELTLTVGDDIYTNIKGFLWAGLGSESPLADNASLK